MTFRIEGDMGATMSNHTMIVFEMLQPYADEVGTILALPPGLRVRFRYKSRWFMAESPSSVLSSKCLIALRNTEMGEVIPLRFGEVVELRTLGDIHYLQVELRSFVELDSGPAGQQEQLSAFNARLRDGPLSRIVNEPNRGMEKLVFATPDYSKDFFNPNYMGEAGATREQAAWSTLVKLLGSLPGYEQLDFYYLSSFAAGTSHNALQRVNGSVPLQANQFYTIDLVQWRTHVDPPKTVSLRVDRSNLSTVLDRQISVGAYDLLRFSLYTHQADYRQRPSSLVLTTSSDSGARLPIPLVIPVHILARPKWPHVISVAAFAAAAIALLFEGLILERLFGTSITTYSSEVTNGLILIAVLASQSLPGLARSLTMNSVKLRGGS
jgi:hypothetical protein